MKRALLGAAAVIVAASIQAQGPLLPNQRPGVTASYIVSLTDTTYSGAGTAKVSGQVARRIPIRLDISADGGTTVQVTEGPLIIKGRSVGRTRVRRLIVDRGGSVKGASPAYFTVPFPVEGVRPGKSWKAGLYGPAPLPGNLTASYKLQAIQGPYAKVLMNIDVNTSCHVVGAGQFYIRTSDGYLDHGKANFDISYVRPDLNDRSKMNINSHDVVAYTIDQR